jgi:hypothetical protein
MTSVAEYITFFLEVNMVDVWDVKTWLAVTALGVVVALTAEWSDQGESTETWGGGAASVATRTIEITHPDIGTLASKRSLPGHPKQPAGDGWCCSCTAFPRPTTRSAPFSRTTSARAGAERGDVHDGHDVAGHLVACRVEPRRS